MPKVWAWALANPTKWAKLVRMAKQGTWKFPPGRLFVVNFEPRPNPHINAEINAGFIRARIAANQAEFAAWLAAEAAAPKPTEPPVYAGECKECLAVFETSNVQQTFCGRTCKRRRGDRQWWRTKRKQAAVAYRCKQCGGEFSASPRSRQAYCGLACKRAHRAAAGLAKSTDPNTP